MLTANTLDVVKFNRLSLTAPWGIRYPAAEGGVHILVSGRCWLDLGFGEPIAMSAGDIVFIARSPGHNLQDSRHSSTSPIRQVLATQLKDAPTTLICGLFQFSDKSFLQSLPSVVHVPGVNGEVQPWVQAYLNAISIEEKVGNESSQLISARLSEVFILQIARAHSEQLAGECSTSLLFNPKLVRLLEQLRQRIEHLWTVDEMASLMGVSRSVLYDDFSRCLGQSPASYLRAIRMLAARRLLVEEQLTVSETARATGYASDAAFCSTFRRHFGETPGEVRRERGLAPIRRVSA